MLTKHELRQRYGTPEEFWQNLIQSVSDMHMPFVQAKDCYDVYRAEWDAAEGEEEE